MNTNNYTNNVHLYVKDYFDFREHRQNSNFVRFNFPKIIGINGEQLMK